MTFLWFTLCLFIYAWVNGSFDFVAHHLGFDDLWHGLKYLDRLFMGLTFWRFMEINYWELGFSTNWINVPVGLLIIMILCFGAKFSVWEIAYRAP